MPLEELNIAPGQVVGGKVQGVTNFGAFIELPGGLVGLVHISEIADTYVKDVKDYLKAGDEVKVKVLNVDGKKVGLSIKQALDRPKPATDANRPRPDAARPRPDFSRPRPDFSRPRPDFPHRRDNSPGEGYYKRPEPEPVTLDDKIAKFMKDSDERMQSLKAKNDNKKRGRYS
jgi:S1 RNA binding domain protein